MAYYERTLAPSEEVSEYGARHLGVDLEWPIWAHYLAVTGADFKPGGPGVPADWRDTGVAADYVKMLVGRHKRHLPTLDEKALYAELRIKDRLPVPDISTYKGRFVPPRILQGPSGPVEDRARCEYYEIKPNSDEGEAAGRKKLKNIDQSYKRHGIHVFYERGKTYPTRNPDYIPLKWSKAFEYLRLTFMRFNGLKRADIDIQVLQLPDPTARGLILYAFRFRIETDDDRALDRLREAAAGLVFAMAVCAAAGILELTLDVVAGTAAESLLSALEKLLESQTLPEVPRSIPKFRVAPEAGRGPRVATEAEELPDELPRVRIELDELERTHEDIEIPRRKRMIVEAVTGRGFAEPGRKFDVYCDEDYFQNVIVDPSVAQRFIGQVRVPLPTSPALVAPTAAASTYLQVIAPGFTLAHRLLEGIENRFPNQAKATLLRPIQNELSRLIGLPERREATIISQVLPGTARMAAFIDPALIANAKTRVDRNDPLRGRGQFVLPEAVLSRWKGRDARMAARKGPDSASDITTLLLGVQPDPAQHTFLMDALADREQLKAALHAAPGFTLAIGTHALYTRNVGGAVSAGARLGELASSIHVSRLFAISARSGSRPPSPYARVDPSTFAENAAELRNASGLYRYLGRLHLAH